MRELEVRLGCATAVVAMDDAACPRTVAAVAALGPSTAPVRFAKIAGKEIFWSVPFLLPVERQSVVTQLHTGAVVYWPERQFLCIYYDQIQEESARVTLLGHVQGGLAELRAEADALWPRQGEDLRVAFQVRGVPPPAGASNAAPATSLAALLAAARLAIAEQPPGELGELLRLRGVMRPTGALLYAEAESRKLQELLWQYWEHAAAGKTGRAAVLSLLPRTVRHFADRLGGWCGLRGCAGVLERAADAWEAAGAWDAAGLEALILYCGQLGGWLDAAVPWDGLHQGLRAAAHHKGEPEA